MATSKIAVTEGSGKNIATVSISEDAVTKELQRVVPVDITGANALPLPSGAATSAKQLPDGHNVVVTSSGLPTGAATSAKQLPDGHNVVVTGAPVTHVIIDSGNPTSITANAGTNLNTSALATESGGNLAAINTVLGAKTDAKSTATDATSVSAMQVLKQISASVQAPPSQAVTFTGSTDVATQTTLAAAKTDLDTIAGAVSSSKINVNISSGNPTTMPVTNTGTFAVQNTSAAGNGKTKKWVTGSASSNGSNTIIAAVGGKKITICGYSLITASTTAVTATFKDGTGGTALWTVPLQAITGTVCGANLATQAPDYFFQGSTNTLVDLYLSSANAVTYSVSYWEE